MQTATFELSVEDLDQRFLEALKALFTGKKVKITVTAGSKNEPKANALSDVITANRQSKVTHQFSAETLDFLIENMESNENFDLIEALEQHRVARSF